MRIFSFNVNGIRAIVGKSFIADMQNEDADIICLQETKATVEQVNTAVSALNGYTVFATEASKKGYSGTAILTKKKPISASFGIGVEEHDNEGRVVCLEYTDFYLVNVYVPNSGNALLRLSYRQEWDSAFCIYLKNLEKTKPVVVCGDFNVAHKSIDLARPKANYNKSAGHMQEEIDGLDCYINAGFVDTFRHLNPFEENQYSWWSYRAGARQRNIGWRIDYFLISKVLLNGLKSATIHQDIMGSDHCPVSISF
ncbi:MAG: exodeoxyribonuclease III [Crocinitomicaceae bacterium]|nr:exodeoxyribonuclease III [Crocinitomicaceae bacterium]